MAEAAGFEHDLFISYAHNDNDAPVVGPGWVEQFQKCLESWLIKRRGFSNLSIWRDVRRMSGNTFFDEAIQKALNHSALFFALVSRNYIKSDYCRNELNLFYQRNGAIPAGLKVGDQCRIFTILLNNIPHGQYQQWSPALQGTDGFVFHDSTSDQDLGDFISPYDVGSFEEHMRPLVDAVEGILKRMTPELPLSVQIDGQSPAAIFVADTAETLQPFRERLMAEIEGRDGALLPAIPPPWEYDSHAANVRRVLGKARFSIHLFDQYRGQRINDRPECTYPLEQFAIARECKALPLIWVPPELDVNAIANETQRRFLLECAHSQREGSDYEFVRTPQSAFINIVLEKLAQPWPAGLSAPAGPTFLVDTHQKDQRYAFTLANYLSESGVAVDFNHESEDPLLSLCKFEKAIGRVKNLIIMFGMVAPEWLQARINLALKTICEQLQSKQECCLENIWVYRVPASREDVSLPPLPPIINIRILDNSHSPSIDPTVAAQLLPFACTAGGGR